MRRENFCDRPCAMVEHGIVTMALTDGAVPGDDRAGSAGCRGSWPADRLGERGGEPGVCVALCRREYSQLAGGTHPWTEHHDAGGAARTRSAE